MRKCFRDQHLGILIRLQESPWPWRSRNPTPNRVVIPASGPYHNPNPLPRPKRQVVAVLSGVARFRPVSILFGVVQTWLKQVSQTDITKSLIRYSGFVAPYQLALLRCRSFLSRLYLTSHFPPLLASTEITARCWDKNGRSPDKGDILRFGGRIRV